MLRCILLFPARLLHLLDMFWHNGGMIAMKVHALCAWQDVVTWKGQLFFEDKAEPEPRKLPGSLVAFTRNGELQGVAYRRALIYSHTTQQSASRSNFGQPGRLHVQRRAVRCGLQARLYTCP